MIVNCFSIFRAVVIRRELSGSIDAKSMTRIAYAIHDTYQMSEDGLYEVITALSTEDGSDWWDKTRFITPAEQRLVRTIVRWLETPVGEDYEDGWGMKSRSTSSLAFENHNRAVGVMLTRIG